MLNNTQNTVNYIGGGNSLQPGDYLYSSNNRFFLSMQTDGNLCVYPGFPTADSDFAPPSIVGVPVWASFGDNPPKDGSWSVSTANGQLSILNGTEVVWVNSPVKAAGEIYAVIQDDGYLCVYDAPAVWAGTPNSLGTDGALWHSDGFPAAAPPEITDPTDFDYRDLVIGALRMIPQAGAIMAFMTGIAWTQPSVWSQIRDEVQALINQSIDEDTWNRLTAHVSGMQGVIDLYTEASEVFVNNPTKDNATALLAQFTASLTKFTGDYRDFKETGHEILLLPLLARVATLHLTLLREGIAYGSNWGAEGQIQDWQNDFNALLLEYQNWVNKWFPLGGNFNTGDPAADFQSGLSYNRLMILKVLTPAMYWKYLDPSVYPPGSPVIPPAPTWEIHSDNYGACSTLALPPLTLLTAPVESLNVSWGDYINMASAAITPVPPPETAKGAANNVGDDNNPTININVLPGNPVTAVDITSVFGLESFPLGDTHMVTSLQFYFKDGSYSGIFGNYSTTGIPIFFGGEPFGFNLISFKDYILSNIYYGHYDYNNGIQNLVFGFRHKDAVLGSVE
jgi:hypothetical protein